jgi:hypothetical protein
LLARLFIPFLYLPLNVFSIALRTRLGFPIFSSLKCHIAFLASLQTL